MAHHRWNRKRVDWQAWIDEGLLVFREADPEQPMMTIRVAWDKVVAARAAYLREEWEESDVQLRMAFARSTQAIFESYDLELTRFADLDLSHRVAVEVFGERMVDPIFDRAQLLRRMMPIRVEVTEDMEARVRRSVAASSEYVALTEGYVF